MALKFLRQQGRDIVDSSGKPVLLHGIGLGTWLLMEGYMWGGRNIPESVFKKDLLKQVGRKKFDAFVRRFRKEFITAQDFQNIKRLGFNSVRIPFHYSLVEKSPRIANREGLELLDWAVDQCARNGIYAILDLHAAPGAQNQDWHGDSTGKAALWDSRSFQKRTVEIWKAVARRYVDEPAVAGYDILNESVTENVLAVNRLTHDIVDGIRSVDDRHIVILEGTQWAQRLDTLVAPFDDNVMYSIHFYHPHPFTFNWDTSAVYPGKIDSVHWNKTQMEKTLQHSIDFSKKHNVPIYIGEFGITSRCAACHHELQWVRDVLSLFKKHRFHWSYWTYKSVGGALFPDGLLQAHDRDFFFQRAESKAGLERFADYLLTRPEDLYDHLRTRHFEINKALLNVLR